MQCPKCKSEAAHRSRSRSRWEAWRKEITGKRLYRCPDCGWRGWAVDDGPSFSEIERTIAGRALAPDPPNLAGTALARDAAGAADVDLDALDS
jgi:DNA-directed RNA polymerase subunit RPC12/RpoP